jgi:uncharacterized protein YbjQ (UPF0145 family)
MTKAKAQAVARAQLAEQASSVLVTTGDVQASYQPLRVIFAIGGSQGGVFKAASPQEAFERACESLQMAAVASGGNAVVFCSFGYNEHSTSGCGGSAFSVHGYGTVVRFV